MEVNTSDQLPEAWKKTFTRQIPILPAILQVITAVAIFVTGCFGEVGIGAPWWSATMFFISGYSLLMLVIKKSAAWEKCAFITIILSITAAVAGTFYYTLKFSLIGSSWIPFAYDTSDPKRLIQSLNVDKAELALISFQLGVSVWILALLQASRKILRQ